MRWKVVTFVLATVAASAAPALATPAAEESAREASARPAVAVQQVQFPLPPIRDEAAMVLVGTALIGLGAVVRRSA